MLGALRFQVSQSRGRRYPELDHPYRNPFQRDRDRVVHARAFRRLEAKTQVFTPGLSDHFRNRLTHTIEVAQISRTIAAQLALNVDLVETLALVHDIGHPPFGHAGEKALDGAMRQHGLFFDHNLHALRIVERFVDVFLCPLHRCQATRRPTGIFTPRCLASDRSDGRLFRMPAPIANLRHVLAVSIDVLLVLDE